MQTTDASCVIGLVLALLFLGMTLVFLSHSPVSVTSLTSLAGPDASLDDDDLPTANGEPAVIEDSIITVYAPGHLHALGYVQVPSQQHRVQLDCSESEARS